MYRLLEKVYNLDEAAPHSLDPYSDDNKAPFYRQPAGLRRAKKHDEKEELGNEILLWNKQDTCSNYTVFSIYLDVTMSLLKQQTPQ